MAGEKLKHILLSRKISLRALCEGARISYTTLYRKMNGITPFDVDDIARISSFLRLSEEEMLDVFFRIEVT